MKILKNILCRLGFHQWSTNGMRCKNCGRWKWSWPSVDKWIEKDD